MKRGFAIISVALVIGALIIIGSGIFTAKFILNKNSAKSPRVANYGEQKNIPEDKPSATNSSDKEDITRESEESVQTPTVYAHPENLYTITMPAGWVVNSTTAINNYSTTKFTGNEGNISITHGSGKDPIGGCSEASSIVLADRTISGCFLLQKDGSKLLSRGYTKTKSGLEITIEAYINSPNAKNLPTILGSIKTIDIN